MPRYYYDGARYTTSSTKSLSTKFLKDYNYLEKDSYKSGGIKWSSNGEPTGNINFSVCLDEERGSYIAFDYKVRDGSYSDWESMSYKFDLEKTPCYFGGYRWWFKCGLYKSGVYCGRRVGILYLTGNYFGCRHCANLSYDSCNTSKRFRGYPFCVLDRETRAEKVLETVKRKFYNGQPTRKYRRYLELAYLDVDVLKVEIDLLKTL